MLTSRCRLLLFSKKIIALNLTKTAYHPRVMSNFVEPIKSPNDYRTYRIIHLANGIKATLISDIDTRKDRPNNDEVKLAAAALSVSAGGFDDPDEVPGLAHFLEHMLFMGSEKYPDENEFGSFVSTHGGSMNAFTFTEWTIFKFDIQPEHFEEALDRWSHFFLSPLLRDDAVQREIKAVDSEFKESLQDDVSRTNEIMAKLARKDHPMSKFWCGNKLSLSKIPAKKGINVMEILRKFFTEKYCTRPMSLVICSTESLDVLEDLAKKYFEPICPRSPRVPDCLKTEFDNPYSDMESFNKLYYVTSVKELHSLYLTWTLPAPDQQHYLKKPTSYISYLLGSEEKGSVYSLLKNKGYVTSLSTYKSDWSMFSTFHCDLELTDDGLKNVAEVFHTIFQYIALLRNNGVVKEIYDEQVELRDIVFRYDEPESPCSHVEDLVENMNIFVDEHLITGDCLIKEYDPQLIESILQCLTTDRVNVFFLSKTFVKMCDKVEKWYKSKYTIKDIPAEWLDKNLCMRYNPELHLPLQNRFIAKNFDMKKERIISKSEYPKVIVDCDYGKIWYRYDHTFYLPKAHVHFKMSSLDDLKSPLHMASKMMFDRIIEYTMAELNYEASRALLDVQCFHDYTGRELSVDGFTHKLFSLFKEVVNELKRFEFSPTAFNVSKEEIMKDSRNDLLDAEQFRSDLRSSIMLKGHVGLETLLREFEHLTEKTLKIYAEEFLLQLHVECLLQGNFTEEEARAFLEYFYQVFQYKPLQKEKLPSLLSLKLPLGRTVCRHMSFNKKDQNTSIENFYQIGICNLRQMTMIGILSHIMFEPLFDTLRTQDQLGYTVGHTVEENGNIVGLHIFVETDVTKSTADYVDNKIEEFLLKFEEKLKNLSEEEYTNYIISFVKGCKEADLSLCDETSRNWTAICHENYLFDRLKRKIIHAEEITKAELLELFQTHFIDRNHVRVLCTQVLGHKQDEDGEELDFDDSFASIEEGSSDESDSDDDESEDEDEEKQLRNPIINLIAVTTTQYTRCIVDIAKFQHENSFYSYAYPEIV